MDVGTTIKPFLPVSGWKAWVGLFLVIVLAVVISRKLGVYQAVAKAAKV